jgi:UDPglucose--hexose-1-phosphate uridylyltransferase
VSIEIAPRERIVDLPSLSAAQRSAFGRILQDVLQRVERLYDEPAPTMMWFNQRPTVSAARSGEINGFDDAWFNVEIVSPWRAAQVMRYIAAAEVATGEYFIPVVPEDLAARLRAG